MLLPSSAENFSLVLVETVAAGVPAIVSPHIGVLELLRPEDARVVPPQPRAWAAAIEETAAAPPVRDGTAFHRVREQFSSANLVPRWLELYRELPAFASPVG
jgi:glycosyltransferase involved in cell wall biosynthesis